MERKKDMGQMSIEVCYNKTMYNCKQCGTEFKGQKYNSNNYCSRDCYYNHRWNPKDRKFKKANGKWYKGECSSCKKPIKGQYTNLCNDCYWSDKRNPVVINGEQIKHYHSAHYWIRKQKGTPNQCDDCGVIYLNTRRFNWANVSNKYLRELSDWKRLCISCHIKFDKQKGAKHEDPIL